MLKRAVVVDRDPQLLRRLSLDLGRAGYSVEPLGDTLGLTPDLLRMSQPDLLVIDAELPGLDRATLEALVRALLDERRLDVAITTDGSISSLRGATQVVPRSAVLERGAQALGVARAGPIDALALIDETLRRTTPKVAEQTLEVKLDLFGPHMVYLAPGGHRGVFVATARLAEVGSPVELRLEVMGRHRAVLRGVVEWQRDKTVLGGPLPSGVGVRLTAPSPADQQALARFVEAREPIHWAGP